MRDHASAPSHAGSSRFSLLIETALTLASLIRRPYQTSRVGLLVCAVMFGAHPCIAQSVAVYGPETLGRADPITPVDLAVGRSIPITTPVPLSKASVVAPDIADIVVVGPRELIVNAKAIGQTDAILWLTNGTRVHLRVSVRSAADRQQVVVYIRFAEVRRDLLRTIGVSALYRDAQGHARVGTGTFNTDSPINPTTGAITLPSSAGFLTILTDFNTKRLLALLDLEEQKGLSRTLAEPNVMAGNREQADFLAGGEIPIPIVQGGGTGANDNRVTILFKEYGVKLHFVPEIISDSLIKLQLSPEVSSIDFSNGVQFSGFLIPAFQTRRVSTTVDVRRDESLIISGLFNDAQSRVKNGIPFLQDIPILGQLFSSTRWQRNESELLVIVTPVIVDPMHPRTADVLPIVPDTALPARGAIQKRLPPAGSPPTRP